jgi:hypothetical protein
MNSSDKDGLCKSAKYSVRFASKSAGPNLDQFSVANCAFDIYVAAGDSNVGTGPYSSPQTALTGRSPEIL